MAGPWFTAAQIKENVARILKEADGPDALEAYWDELCSEAEQSAYRDLATILLEKGYTMAQLDAWDFRASYSRQQALFWLLTETSLGIGYDDKEILKLDHRASLAKSSSIMIGGELVSPQAEESATGVAGGVISEEGYRFTGETEF